MLIHEEVKYLVSKGLFGQALRLFKQEFHFPHQILPQQNTTTSIILPSIIKACSSSPNFLHFGLQLHCFSIKTGFDLDPFIANSILSMYGKFSQIQSAGQMFDTMPVRDTITWNIIINSYIQHQHYTQALFMFKEMYLMGFQLKPELIASILSLVEELRLGKEIHARSYRDGTMINPSSIFVQTALLDMYSRCFDLFVALRVFDQMSERNEVSWTAMICGCILNEKYSFSLELFRAMQIRGTRPNRVTLTAVLPACAELNEPKMGKQIHGYAIRHGFGSESKFGTALIGVYCKCGETLDYAKLIFERHMTKDIVMWSSMIGSYSLNGDIEGAMKHFCRMLMDGIRPNSVTLLAIIKVCATKLSLVHGEVVHCYTLKSGLNLEPSVGNSLIDMYAKCGWPDASHKVFTEIPARDSISWSSLIRGYGLNGHGKDALKLFHEMEESKIDIDSITYLAVLSACNHAGLVEEGQDLFNRMIQKNSRVLTVEHFSCYVDILGRYGKLEEAYKVIKNMPMKPNASIFSSFVTACKAHGRLEMAEKSAQELIDLEPYNAANYTLLCMVYAETGNWRGAEEVRRVMKFKGIKKTSGYSWIEPNNRVSKETTSSSFSCRANDFL